MSRTVLAVAWFGYLASFGALGGGGSAEGAAPLRVGTYDNRAIAVAYAASKYNPVAHKMEQHKKAKADGDTARVKELEAWGAQHQRQLHRQGFGRVPVDDLLDNVKDRIPEAARKAGVAVIVWQCDYAADNVEQVDVTDELVALFDPSEKTLETIRQLKKQAPLDLDVIEQSHEH